jgi:phospholipase C
MRMRKAATSAIVLGSAAVLAIPAVTRFAAADAPPPPAITTTPISHLVVIFQENVSFDHYFGTYPNAANTSGEEFNAKPGTPAVNGLTKALLTSNPNGANPRRLDPANINDVLTCDQDHGYTDEQKAFDNGLMDKFPASVGTAKGSSNTGQACQASDVMNYYDGNTVTAYWNYAQHFAMSDASFDTTFGPSSPGAINLISGDTGAVDTTHTDDPGGTAGNNPLTNGDTVSDGNGGVSLISDAQPYYDDCSTRDAVAMSGTNIGDELNKAGLSWGWFQGGFRPTTTFAVAAPGQATSTFTPDQFNGAFAKAPASNQGICNAVHPVGPAVGGTGQYGYKDDYIPHHEPFQYYATTANPHHLAPTSVAAIGTDTQTFVGGVPQFDSANHQYDISDFNALLGAISHGYLSPDHLPAVSFLKAPGNQDGHAGYSDPLDEQAFVTTEINALERTPDWSSTAVVVAYDDSDGWYDHVFAGVHNASDTTADVLTGVNMCGNSVANPPLAGENGRCSYGARMPMLIISPWAKQNFVDHTTTDLSSIVKFVQDNWSLPPISGSFANIAGTIENAFDFSGHHGNAQKLFLDPVTGRSFDS